ncbi:flagellar biosynthetic protein FliO [Paenibacillus sp. TRM 82003]|nr:flagellar biosynthetic protein FliO [Paenibacillus sp. TRM 82003]
MYSYLVGRLGPSLDMPSDTAPPEIPQMDYTGNIVSVIVTLAVIVGIIVLLIRFLAAKNKGWSGDRSLRVHAGVALGQHKSLQIVEIGDAVYIVGVGDDITLLDKIDDPERAEALLASIELRPSAASGKAVAALTRWITRLRQEKGPVEASPSRHTNEAFRDLLNKKLNGIGSRKETMKSWMDEESNQRRSEDGT